MDSVFPKGNFASYFDLYNKLENLYLIRMDLLSLVSFILPLVEFNCLNQDYKLKHLVLIII